MTAPIFVDRNVLRSGCPDVSFSGGGNVEPMAQGERLDKEARGAFGART